jgi:DNA (cytosine-5)-methyltransferase 1
VSGEAHPFVVLKSGEKLLSCSKRDSPIHSEIIDLDRPSKTIICTYDHQPRLLVGLKRGTESWVRTLFPDELKQIQGFPAEFLLRGNKKEQVVQVGNAVPPSLVEAVARALFPT